MNRLLFTARVKPYSDPAGLWARNLLRQYVHDDLHDLLDPIAERRFIGQIANLERNSEIGFHGDKGPGGPIGMDTVLAKGNGTGLCLWLQSLDRMLKISRKLKQGLIGPLISTAAVGGQCRCG